MEFRLWLEGAEEDQRAVKTAVRVWNKIVKEIDKIPLEVREIQSVRQGKIVPFKGLVFDLGIVFPEFRGLTVFLCGGLGSAAAYSKPLNIIFINLLGRDEQFNDGSKRIAKLRIRTWSKERGSSFIHEFIHYLDGQRDNMVWPDPSKYNDDEDAYFNSPLEFNAFYQELIAKLNKDLRKDHFLKSFNYFMMIATRKMSEFPRKSPPPRLYSHRTIDEPGEKWIDKLNPTYKRKLIRRLYQYYAMRRSQYEDISESSDIDDAWRDYRSWKLSQGEDWGPNTKDNLDRLERIRRMGVARNAEGAQDHSARMKHLPKWLHSPDGKRLEYETPEGSYVIRKDEGDFRPGGDWELTAPDGEHVGHYPTPEEAAETAGSDWAENFS